jgi:hypothetical protein
MTSEVVCQECGGPITLPDRPGAHRLYCSMTCATATAERRRKARYHARNSEHGYTDGQGVRWLSGVYREGCPLCDPDAGKMGP